MPIQHIVYIPTIFLLGFAMGAFFISQRMENSASPKTQMYRVTGGKLFLTFMIFIVMFVATHAIEIPYGAKAVHHLLGGHELLDRRPIFGSDNVYKQVLKYSVEGIDAYKRFTYTSDILFPASFFFFLFTFTRFVMERSQQKGLLLKMVPYIPVLWFTSDLVENAMVFSILSSMPSKSIVLGNVIGVITTLKFGLVILSLVVPVMFLVFQKRSQTSALVMPVGVHKEEK